MPTIEHTPVAIKDNDGNPKPGQMQATLFDHNDCVKRALSLLGLFWLLGGISLFIPLAHFVLVPGFLIAGPVIAYLTYKTTRRRDHVDGECPVCKETIKIKMEAKDELPKWTYCPACTAPLQITSSDQNS
jgi:hypothetical protein